jgi:Family of unknown function (DUF6232)
VKSTSVQVRISEGVLWVGGDAYPLRNIARVSSKAYVFDRSAAISRFVKVTIGLLILTAIVAAIKPFLVAYRLAQDLNIPSLYALFVETAGNPQAALTTTNGALVNRLIEEITSAIGHPQTAELQPISVSNFYDIGDKFTVSGSGNVGKVSR